jgi:hypothetical protein
VNPGNATVLVVTAPAAIETAGVPFAVTVKAQDGYGNTATGYVGPIHFTSTDSHADLPADYTFVPGTDQGTHTFSVTLHSAGQWTVTATDVPSPSVFGVSGTITVQAGPAAKLTFKTQPTNTLVGVAIADFAVEVQDADGNPVTTSSAAIGIVLGNNPNSAVLSGTATVSAVNGVATFSGLTLDKAATGYTLVASSAPLTSATSDQFNVGKGAATLSLANLNSTYDGSPKSASATTTPAGLAGVSITYDGSATAPTSAGSYAVVASLNNPDYQAPNATGTLVIAMAGSTTTVTCPASVTYTGSAQTPCTATVTGVGGLSQSVAVTYANNINAGTATASATFAGDANHSGSSDSKTFTIAAAGSTTTLSCPASVTYTGAAQMPCTATVTGAGGLSQSPTVSYTNNISAGTASASANFAGDANHTGSGNSKTFTINKANPTTTFTGAPASAPYQGAFTVVSTTNSTATPTYSSSGGACSNAGTLYAMTSGTGTCTSTVTWPAGNNDNGATRTQSKTATKIDPAVSRTSSATGNYQFTAVATTNASTSVTITVDSGSAGVCSISGTTVTMLTGTGSCELTASWPADGNYNAATAHSSTTASSACTISGVDIGNTSWNSFKIPAGTSPFVWVHAHIGKPNGVPTNAITTMLFTGITLTLDGVSYPLNNGVLTFDPAAPSTITTTYNSGLNRWETRVNPNNLSDEIFFTGTAIPVTLANANSAKATVTYDVSSSAPHVSLPWQWSAAVYTFWPANGYAGAQIQPYHSGNHAGTPLNPTVQQSLIQGPRGGGGSNFTGSWSGTGNAACL